MFWFWRKDKTKKNLGFRRKNYRMTREPFLYALWEVILNKARPRLSCMCLTKVLVEHFVLCFIPIDSFTVRLQTFSRHHHHTENVTAYFCANFWISFESCISDIWHLTAVWETFYDDFFYHTELKFCNRLTNQNRGKTKKFEQCSNSEMCPCTCKSQLLLAAINFPKSSKYGWYKWRNEAKLLALKVRWLLILSHPRSGFEFLEAWKVTIHTNAHAKKIHS